jgi:hypothetical protein
MFLRLLALVAVLVGAAISASAQTPTPAATTNGSVVITTGNIFQPILAALGAPPAQRRSLTIENNNATDSCFVFIMGVGETTPTAARSILLLPGGSYTRYFPYVPADAIQGTCASNSDTLYVDTQ